MALAVTVAYAGQKEPPPVVIPEEAVDFSDDEDDFLPPEPEEIEEEEEEELPPPRPVQEEPDRHFSLQLNSQFGRNIGCMLPNCQSFTPVCGGYMQVSMNVCMPPNQMQNPNVIYQDVYVPAQQSGMPMMGFCPCQGQMGCGCGAQTNVLLVNSMQRTPDFTPRWGGLRTQGIPVWGPTPQAQFVIPQMQEQNLGHRVGGFIDRNTQIYPQQQMYNPNQMPINTQYP